MSSSAPRWMLSKTHQKKAIHGQVYHRTVFCHARRARSGEESLSGSCRRRRGRCRRCARGQTQGFAEVFATSPHGSGSRRGKTRPAERAVSAASPNAAMAVSGGCSSAAPWRRCSARESSRTIPGFAGSAPASRRWSQRWRWPTRSRAPFGPSCGTRRTGGQRHRPTSLPPCSPPSRPCRLRRRPRPVLAAGCAWRHQPGSRDAETSLSRPEKLTLARAKRADGCNGPSVDPTDRATPEVSHGTLIPAN